MKPDSSTSEQINTVIDSAEDTEGRLQCGRKWLVLLAAFLSLGLSTGFPFNMSVLYVEWLQEFGKSNSETSLIQSVCTGLFLIGGELHTQIYFIFTVLLNYLSKQLRKTLNVVFY